MIGVLLPAAARATRKKGNKMIEMLTRRIRMNNLTTMAAMGSLLLAGACSKDETRSPAAGASVQTTATVPASAQVSPTAAATTPMAPMGPGMMGSSHPMGPNLPMGPGMGHGLAMHDGGHPQRGTHE